MDQHLLALGSLFAVSLATSLIPGPTNFLIVRIAMRRGRPAAVAAALGTTVGCLVWCAAALIGLAALLAAVPWLYKALRIAGGLYLLWFAVGLWRAKAEPAPPADAPDRPGGAFWSGFAICLTNPKSVLFFASIFSAYVGPDMPDWMHAAAAAVVTATCLGWCVALAWLFSAPAAVQAYARAQRPLDRIAAAVMAVFGVSLLWTFG